MELVGILGPERRRVAVFSDGESILNVLKDDVINEKFIVRSIGYQSVELGFVGFPQATPQRVTIGGS